MISLIDSLFNWSFASNDSLASNKNKKLTACTHEVYFFLLWKFAWIFSTRIYLSLLCSLFKTSSVHEKRCSLWERKKYTSADNSFFPTKKVSIHPQGKSSILLSRSSLFWNPEVSILLKKIEEKCPLYTFCFIDFFLKIEEKSWS